MIERSRLTIMPKRNIPTPRATAAPLVTPGPATAAVNSAARQTGGLNPLVLGLFIGSGCAALIYEIVWFQLLELVLGSSGISLGLLLATYMGGMCAGSLLLPRLISARHHPLRVYALLELGIGLIALFVLFGLPLVGGLYTANAGHGFIGLLLRGLVSTLFLLPPTLLMGATLPAISRWIETTPAGVSWLGLFYTANIGGAVFGCLLAGFYLLRVHDMAFATYVAVAINLAIAALGLTLAARRPGHAGRSTEAPAAQGMQESLTDGLKATPLFDAPAQRRQAWAVYVAIALSGLTALGAEVIWTRELSLLLGASVYTFSIILAVFLIGLGIGSSAGSMLARTAGNPRATLGWCQMLLVAGIAWTANMIGRSLPWWPINPSLATSAWFNFQLDLVRCLWAILPPAVLWGASFPLALAVAAGFEGGADGRHAPASRGARTEGRAPDRVAGEAHTASGRRAHMEGRDPAQMVGRVYAANTVGAILGSLAFSMFFIPTLGTQQSQRLLAAISAAAGLLMLAPLFAGKPVAEGDAVRPAYGPGHALALAVSLVVTIVLLRTMPPLPGGLVAYGRYLVTKDFVPNVLYMGEGMNADVAVTQLSNGVRNFHVSGKIEASTEPSDMRLQRMLGHLSALLHPHPKSVLIVGFGAGVTAGTFVRYPDIERIVICEIEPLIPQVVSRFFSEQNYDVLKDPRVTVVYDDARHFVLTTDQKFDVITSDPIHPWVKGAATLYTKEYFDLVKRHLNPGGVITQWVPLYESTTDVVKSEMATFFDVFPHGNVWGNDIDGRGYDLVVSGQLDASPIDVDAMQERLHRPDYMPVLLSLGDVQFYSAIDLLSTWAGRGQDLAPWLKGAAINTDRNLRLQYLAGMGLNLYQEGTIYDEMLRYRRFPDDLFVASDPTREALRLAVMRKQAGE